MVEVKVVRWQMSVGSHEVYMLVRAVRLVHDQRKISIEEAM